MAHQDVTSCEMIIRIRALLAAAGFWGVSFIATPGYCWGVGMSELQTGEVET